MPLELVRVSSQKELQEIADERGSIRTGQTVDPVARASAYRHEGYGGTMYYAKTNNMAYAENRLLDNGLRHNVQRNAGSGDGQPGYVYVIKGRKYQ